MTFEPLTLLGAVEPLAFGAGGGVIGLLLTLTYVMLKYVNSQGGAWQTLVHEAQADAASSRSEAASLRLELATERAEHAVTRVEVRDLHKQIRGQSP